MNLFDRGKAAADHIRHHPGCSTAQIAEAIGETESATYVALYRNGRQYGVGLTATDGWQPNKSSPEVEEQLDALMLPPCPSPTEAEHMTA